jgi:hypothetical protein
MMKRVGSINQRHGSGDPDPHQYVTDPQHWYKELVGFGRACAHPSFWAH